MHIVQDERLVIHVCHPCSIFALLIGLKATGKSPWHTLRVMAVRVKEKPEASIFNRASTTSGNSLY